MKSPPDFAPRTKRSTLALWVTGTVVVVGLALTVAAWNTALDTRQRLLSTSLEYRGRDAVSRITSRLSQYEQALVDTRGLLEATGSVTREQFQAFVARWDAPRRFPALADIGYAARDTRVVYSESFRRVDPTAVGFDVLADAASREALTRAEQTGEPALSGPIAYPGQAGGSSAALLLCVPIESSKEGPAGWVYGTIEVDGLLSGVLGEGASDLALTLKEGSPESQPGAGFEPGQDVRHALGFGGHPWTVTSRALPTLLARQGGDWSAVVLLLGSLLTALLSATVFLVLRQLEKARRLNEVLENTVQERTRDLQTNMQHFQRLSDSLQEERQRLASIIAGTNVGTWEWNVQTGETIFNERWAEIVGYRLAELAPVSLDTWLKLAHPDDLKQSEFLLNEHFEGRIAYYEFESRMKHKDGHWVWVLDRGAVARWDNGKPVMMMGTHTDITARKEAEATAADLAARSHQLHKGESLARMAGSIAHHFNNKLQAVMSNLEIVANLTTGERTTKYLDRAKTSAERAAEMSRLLLTYLGQDRLPQSPQHLGPLLLRCLRSLEAALPKTVALETTVVSPGPVVAANTEQLEQLLGCLLTNAGEAIGAVPGQIVVGLTTVAATAIPRVPHYPAGWQARNSDYACLSVGDSGSGIAAGDLERVFDPFFSTKEAGRGLGLSVALGIVQVHGGMLTVETAPTRGTTFRVFLPVSEAELAVPLEELVPESQVDARPAILWVDDDEMLLESAAELVELLEFTVLTARDGLEALELFQKHRDKIRCVVTDLTMPRMDGWELMAALRDLSPELPVILASGYDKAQVFSDEQVLRPHAFLSKPFDVGQIRQELAFLRRGPHS